ncbi:hypothetical protein NDU88_009985 [Pleurodeles waltl]|uniref:Uncharacterized protein n=1 Tax=Pleurodeles waltl TaxID=8319 RepID=A0AAV7PXD7_PLEWA|nr:hypothetical protein NDU88_009985 [Pleurodeles waltl]
MAPGYLVLDYLAFSLSRCPLLPADNCLALPGFSCPLPRHEVKQEEGGCHQGSVNCFQWARAYRPPWALCAVFGLAEVRALGRGGASPPPTAPGQSALRPTTPLSQRSLVLDYLPAAPRLGTVSGGNQQALPIYGAGSSLQLQLARYQRTPHSSAGYAGLAPSAPQQLEPLSSS